MPSTQPPINHEVLKWAVAESGYSPEDLAGRLKVDEADVEAWIDGERKPTQGQFTQIAKHLRRPKSIFFLPAAPESSTPPELRRAVGSTPRNLNPEERLWVRRAQRLQGLLSLLAEEAGADAVAIPHSAPESDPGDAGRLLREWLEVTITKQTGEKSPRGAFQVWREAFEHRGIGALQLKLGNGGLRGFALTDSYAPLVAVNTRENWAARTFTLLHELAHLASATGTACLAEDRQAAVSIERWCDAAASEAVLPRAALQAELARRSPADEPGFSLVQSLAKRFNVSLRATAVALIQAKLAPPSLYGEVQSRAPWLGDFEKGRSFGTGGRIAPIQRLQEIGPRSARTVLDAMAEDRITELDARNYLRLDGAHLYVLAGEVGSKL